MILSKYLLLILFTFNMYVNAYADFTIVHYNVKELETKKINDPENTQLKKFKEAMSFFDYAILSLNEVQYDQGNLKKIAGLLDLKGWNEAFYPANTGKDAKEGKPDQINYGKFPGQYSTGLLTKFKIKKVVEIHDLKWKSFHPTRDLTPYKTVDGKPLPDEIELFDKNFMDVTLEIEGKEVHLILLHTVPAYGFGNKNTVNFIRNADQLRFLEWYLSGRTDFAVSKKLTIKPLPKNATFIAVGDWNTDIGHTNNPGTLVLKRILELHKPWVKHKEIKPTHEVEEYSAHPLSLKLDYMVVSKDLNIKFSGVWRPESKWTDMGCKAKPKKAPGKNLVIISYQKQGKDCFAAISEEYHLLKQVSDHFPIWATLSFDKS